MKLCLAVLALIGSATPARGQDTLTTWDGMQTSNLLTVHVLDDSGTETTGTLIRLDPDSILLLVDGNERRIEAARVRRLERRGDSLKNGAILGAVAGAVLSAIGLAAADCPDAARRCVGSKFAFGFIGTGLYAAVGVGIDAVITGRTALYESPVGPAFGAEGSSNNVPNPSGRLLRVSLRW